MNEIPTTSESEEHDQKGRDIQDSIMSNVLGGIGCFSIGVTYY